MNSSTLSTSISEDNDDLLISDLEKTISTNINLLKLQQDKYKLKKLLMNQKQEDILNNKLIVLENNIINDSNDRNILNDKIYNLKYNYDEQKKKEKKMRDELFELERQQEIETLALKRIELLDIIEKKNSLSHIVDLHNTQLEAISEEEYRRDTASVESLNYLLSKADVLEREFNSGIYDQKQKAKLAQLFYENIDNGTALKENNFKIVDEISSNLKIKHEKAILDVELQTQNLNEKRYTIIKEREALERKKREFEFIKSKGIDFMTEVELGNAPPISFLLINSKINEINNKPFVPPVSNMPNVTDIDSKVLKIENLKKQLEFDKKLISKKEYDGELGFQSYPTESQNNYFFMRDILNGIIPKILDKICIADSTRDLEFERSNYESFKNKVINKQMENIREHLIVQEYRDILESVMMEGLQSLFGDLQTFSTIALSLTQEVVMVALENQPDFSSDRELISKTYEELVKQRNNEGTGFRFIHGYSLSRVTVDPEVLSTYDLPLALQDKVRDSKSFMKSYESIASDSVFVRNPTVPNDLNKIKESKPVEDRIHYTSSEEYRSKLVTNATTKVSVDTLHKPLGIDDNSKIKRIKILSIPTTKAEIFSSEDVNEYERYYFQNMRVESKIFKGRGSNFTCVSGNNTGKLIACGNSNGGFCIFAEESGLLLYYLEYSSTSAPIYSITFSPAPLPSLLTLDDHGCVRLYNLGNYSNKGFLDSEIEPALVWESRLGEFWRTPDGQHPTDLDLLNIACYKVSFHPCFTLFGQFPSFICCLHDGTMVRMNTMDCSFKNKIVVHGQSIDAKEQFSPLVELRAKQLLEGNNVPKNFFIPTAATVDYTYREFFQEHSCLIVCVHFTADAHVLSLDISGKLNVWKYDRAHFSGFGWFLPIKSFQFDTIEPSFAPVSDPNVPDVVKLLYPIVFPEDDPNKPLNFVLREKRKLQAERQYQSLFDSLILEKDPVIQHNNEDGTFEKVYLPANANNSAEQFIIGHSFTYPYNLIDSDQKEEICIHNKHVAIKFERKERRGIIIDAKFSSSGFDIILFLFYPALFINSNSDSDVIPGFEAVLQFRILRMNEIYNLQLTNFMINLPIPPNLRDPPPNLNFYVTPAFDVPGTDFIFFIDSSSSIHVYSIANMQKVNLPFEVAFPEMLKDRMSKFSYNLYGTSQLNLAVVSNNSNTCGVHKYRDVNIKEVRELFTGNFLATRKVNNPNDYLHSRISRIPSHHLLRNEDYEKHVLGYLGKTPNLLGNPHRYITKMLNNLIENIVNNRN